MQSIQEADGWCGDGNFTPHGAGPDPYSESSGSRHLTAVARFEDATYSAVQEGALLSASSRMFGKVHGMSLHSPAAPARPESDASDASEFKIGLLPFETRLK